MVFGLPGGETAALLDAIRAAGLRFVLVHNEASALFMADAAARLTRKPGVALATLGPGATNAAVGVAHAALDRAPVLFLTAQIPNSARPLRTHQYVDLEGMFGVVTKASGSVRPAGGRETVRAAIGLTAAGRPGPVHLHLSSEAAAARVGDGPSALAQAYRPEDGDGRAGLADAVQLLEKSQRPLILAGLGLEPEAPYASLLTLVEGLQAPVIMTPKAKGCLPDDHPLAAGAIGLTREDPAYHLLEEADCLIAVGFDVVELVRDWKQTQPLIWIAPWPNADPVLPAEVEFVGRMTPVLERLARLGRTPADDWGTARVGRHIQSLGKASPSFEPAPGKMLPQTVLQTVRRIVPRNAIVTTDVGSHKILAALTWPTYTPNSYLVANGLSPMGFGLPAAVAAGLVEPGRPVVCFTGDGGLAMVQGELGLLRELESPVLIVVLRDDALDLIRSHQIRSGYPVFGTEFRGPEWTAIARAYGLQAWRVGDPDDCARAIQAALRSGRPALIEASIDPRGYPTTPSVNRAGEH